LCIIFVAYSHFFPSNFLEFTILCFISVTLNNLVIFLIGFAVVTLPSLHHNWSVSNPSIAQVDTMMGVTRAISLGETVVIVEDTRVAGHIQVSTLNVVLPDTLCLYISPLSGSGDPVEGTEAIPSVARWYVVSGRQYLIQMKVFSHGPSAQEIYITKV
jgi:nuclear pore complex protein Nup210